MPYQENEVIPNASGQECCSFCGNHLTSIDWNSKSDILICKAVDCLIYHSPQKVVSKVRRKKGVWEA